MIKKHNIGRILTIVAAFFLITHAAVAAADKAVVIPLESDSGDSGGVRTVISAGQVWMDRNLGAHRAATKSDDSQAYGSLYQWGRLGDGHEYRESPTTSTQSSGNVPGHGDFITGNDWRSTPYNNLWQGESGINNPCPAGFRLPTETEWETERASWGSNNAAGAFGSPLRLGAAGFRRSNNGNLANAGFDGYYWSSTFDGNQSRYLSFTSFSASVGSDFRALGFSVRCIKD